MLWETSQQLADLPPIPPETRRFIAAFLNCDQDINELAAQLNEDFFDAVRRLSEPATRLWIAAINALKNNERRERALRALDAALTTEHNPNTIRRAATRILRHLELSRPRTPRAPHVDTGDHPPSPEPTNPKQPSTQVHPNPIPPTDQTRPTYPTLHPHTRPSPNPASNPPETAIRLPVCGPSP